jgi:hypothetical protein
LKALASLKAKLDTRRLSRYQINYDDDAVSNFATHNNRFVIMHGEPGRREKRCGGKDNRTKKRVVYSIVVSLINYNYNCVISKVTQLIASI